MSHKIEDILDECLSLMAQGRTVEECLARYPEQAADLEPLLRTALTGQQAMGSPRPSPVARAAGRQQLMTALAARRERRRRFFPLRGWALAMASLVLTLFLGTGTVLASLQSVPEEPLYPVKQTVERVQLVLSPSSESRARTLVRHSDNRLKEIEALEKKGKALAAEKLRERLRGQLRKVAALAIAVEQRGGDGRVVIAVMERNLARHRARLLEKGAAPQALMGQIEKATPQDTPVPSAVPAPHPRQTPPGLERQPRPLPPRARRALEKALDDYQQALERLKTQIERRHNRRPPAHPRRPER